MAKKKTSTNAAEHGKGEHVTFDGPTETQYGAKCWRFSGEKKWADSQVSATIVDCWCQINHGMALQEKPGRWEFIFAGAIEGPAHLSVVEIKGDLHRVTSKSVILQ